MPITKTIVTGRVRRFLSFTLLDRPVIRKAVGIIEIAHMAAGCKRKTFL